MATLLLVFIAIEAYLLGGVNGAIIASKYIFRRDIRNFGSRNAGLTNFYRTFGAPGAALVIAIDVLKSVVAVLLGGLLLGFVKEPMLGKLFAGFCAILGHSFPAYYGFKGGKGVLCGLILVFLADWRIAFVCLVVFLAVLILTRYVSLSSLLGSIMLPIGLWIAHGGMEGTLGLFCCLLIAFQHRENIGRLLSRSEPKLNLSVKPKQKFEE